MAPLVGEITVYGRTRATYEAVTRVPGFYERCLRGIDLLLARQIPLTLKTTVTTENAHEIFELQAWAENLGVSYRYDPLLNARLDGGLGPLALRPTPEQAMEFDLKDQARLKDLQRLASRFSCPQAADQFYQCGAGVNAFYVDPYGQMSLCLLSRTPSYDLTQGRFDDAWHVRSSRCRLRT